MAKPLYSAIFKLKHLKQTKFSCILRNKLLGILSIKQNSLWGNTMLANILMITLAVNSGLYLGTILYSYYLSTREHQSFK